MTTHTRTIFVVVKLTRGRPEISGAFDTREKAEKVAEKMQKAYGGTFEIEETIFFDFSK